MKGINFMNRVGILEIRTTFYVDLESTSLDCRISFESYEKTISCGVDGSITRDIRAAKFSAINQWRIHTIPIVYLKPIKPKQS